MRYASFVAIGLVWLTVGPARTMADDAPSLAIVNRDDQSEHLAPIISLCDYQNANAAVPEMPADVAPPAEPPASAPDSLIDLFLPQEADQDTELPLPAASAPAVEPAADEPAAVEPAADEPAAGADNGESQPAVVDVPPPSPSNPFADEGNGQSPPEGAPTLPPDAAVAPVDAAAVPADTAVAPPETGLAPEPDEPTGLSLEAIPTPPFERDFGGSGTMELACSKSWLDDCSCQACCLPHWRTFGDFLLLRPTNAEVAYAETINGAITQTAVPLQVSPITTVEPDYEPGFRVGVSRVFCDCSSLTLSYSHLDTNTFSDLSTNPPRVIRSLVRHPGDQTAAIDNLFAEANYDVSFQIVDLDYRDVWKSRPWYSISYLVGLRYAHLKQDFASEFSSLGTEYVSTAIDFDGGGLRVGLEGERRLGCCGLSVYGRGVANILGGEFTGTYHQSNTFAGPVVDTSWKAQRIVSILDLEAGLQYTCCDGCVSLAAGYQFSGWYNAVTTQDFIRGVQTNNFDELSNILGFEGFVARVEVRF